MGKGKGKGKVLGILKIRVLRGIDLAVRDTTSCTSDPYVVVTIGNQARSFTYPFPFFNLLCIPHAI